MKHAFQNKKILISIMSIVLLLNMVNAFYYQFMMTSEKTASIYSNVFLQVLLMLIGFIAYNNKYKLLAISFISYFSLHTLYQVSISLIDYTAVANLYSPNDLILPLVLITARSILSLYICISGITILKIKENWISE